MPAKKTNKRVEEEVMVQQEVLEEQVEEVELEEEYEDLLEDDGVEEGQAFFDNDGNEVLYPDGPLVSLVEEWKSRYGAVYLTEFDDDVFIWRTITRKEYKEVMKVQNADTYYKEERICDKCVLWPEGYNFLKMTHGLAGTPSLLAEQIMDKSGFTARTGAIRI